MNNALFAIFLMAATPAFACHFENISFSADMESGRLAHCEEEAKNHYHLYFKPEDKKINPSPWFYFSYQGQQADEVTLTLDFGDFSPRYLPKKSVDGHHWQPVAFSTNANTMKIDVDVSSTPTFIAGQPPFVHDDYTQWLWQIASTRDSKVTVLGKSLEGRAIDQLVIDNNASQWLVLIGRQHPPEITGARALKAFVDEMTAKTELSNRFFARFNVMLVPELNVDGVAKGNWRHSQGHVDLNRDWKAFTQPETRLVRDALDKKIADGDNIAMAVDFHSTYYDVFYTISQDAGVTPPGLVEAWLALLDKNTAGLFRPTEKPGNSPDKGVFKQFIADRYDAHGVTYEVGDNTPPEKIDYVARSAARSLMQTMLTYSDSDYTANQPAQ